MVHEMKAAIMFLGAPHRGSSPAKLGKVASHPASTILMDTDQRLIDSLHCDGELLDNIHADFMKMVHNEDFQVHSFQEGRTLSGLRLLNSMVISFPS